MRFLDKYYLNGVFSATQTVFVIITNFFLLQKYAFIFPVFLCLHSEGQSTHSENTESISLLNKSNTILQEIIHSCISLDKSSKVCQTGDWEREEPQFKLLIMIYR